MPSRRSAALDDSRPLPSLALTLDELSRPTPDEEARLLRAAQKIWELAPWETWSEESLFAVKNPEDDQLGFVSVLGGGGEQMAVVVYRGADAYFGLLDFIARMTMTEMPSFLDADTHAPLPTSFADFMKQMQSTLVDPTELINLSQMHLDFEAKRDLDALDKEWIARHKYKAKGRGFPTFRSFVTGYLPWWVSSDEARFLATALEQLIELVERPDFDGEMLEPKESGRQTPVHELFARLPQTGENGAVIWSDGRVKVSPGQQTFRVELEPDEELLERIAALPQGKTPLEIELLSMPVPLGDEQRRPCFPSILLSGGQNKVESHDIIPCGSPSPYLVAPLLDAVLKLLAARSEKPSLIQIASPELSIVQAVSEMIGVPVKMVDELPTLDPAIEAFMAKMQSDDPFADLSEEELAELDATDLDDSLPRRLH